MAKKKRKKIEFAYKRFSGATRAKTRIRKAGRPKLKRRFGSSVIKGKLNCRTRKTVIEGVKLGLPLKSCARLIGISEQTMNAWMHYGKDPKRCKYYYFRKKVFAARVQRELEALENIRKAGKGGFKKTETTIKRGPKGIEEIVKVSQSYPQWQAEAWFLERRHKDEYARETNDIDKTPEDLAREIRDAYKSLKNSVPTMK